MDAFKWIWGHTKKFKYQMLFAFTLVLVCSLTSMAVPYFSGVIVDKVILGKNTEILMPIIGIMIVITLARSIRKLKWLFNRASKGF
jgi:ATP-binding cassette subfamily B multidrug efflux pump